MKKIIFGILIVFPSLVICQTSVDKGDLPAVVMVSPCGGTQTPVLFEWLSVNLPNVSYNLIVSTNSDLSYPVVDIITSKTESSELLYSGSYFWAARVHFLGNFGPISEICYIQVD